MVRMAGVTTAAWLGVIEPSKPGLEQLVSDGPACGLELDTLTALRGIPDLLQSQRFGLLHQDSHCLQHAPYEAMCPFLHTALGLLQNRPVAQH